MSSILATDLHCLQLSLDSLADNLALDEALLLAAEEGASGPVLRIWECSRRCVVLGAGCNLTADVDESACLADGVPILRRGSGGGTVLLGAGCLLYSLVLACDEAPALKQIGSSYCYILNRMCKALAVPGLRIAGTSDLAVGSQKVSGNAQQRKRRFLLHHGTILHAFDAASAGRYLRMPGRQPSYRQQRPDVEFLTNLPLTPDEIVWRLRQEFGADRERTEWPSELVRALVADKYSDANWTRRR
jgi:lipoate---protein ligase